MPARLPQDDALDESRFRLGYDPYTCRYCGATCRDGAVCVAHSDIHRLDDETLAAAVQLSIDDVLALEGDADA